MNGFTKADNWLWDYVMPKASPNTFKVVCAVVRATAGWQKEWAELTFDDFKDLTGIGGRSTLNRAISDAIDEGFVVRTETGRSFSYSTNTVPADSTKTVLQDETTVPERDYEQYQNGTEDSTKTELPTTYPKEKENIKTTKEKDADSLYADAVAAYENNIAIITKKVGEEISDAINRLPEGWVVDAIGLAAKANVRNWNYVSAVLENWERQGYQSNGRNDKQAANGTIKVRTR